MSELDETNDVKQLEARIKVAREAQIPRREQEEHYSQAQLAWRMVIELVAGLCTGFGMGYGLDYVLGTTPWLMIVFIFLGFAAGIQTMMRSAREIQLMQDKPSSDVVSEKGD
ncbi:MAG: AtpZ/AtpI family protein [Aestuariivita sp.]|nr:AtpZ/AtpI family protein [Aestuariivita sp.]